MTITQEEAKIIKRVRSEMLKATDRDGINKIYRQARIWGRYHYSFAGACSYQKHVYLNHKFKHLRYDALRALI